MPAGYVLAFDFGLSRTGVAVGQTVTGNARGVATLICRDGKPNWREVAALVDEYAPSALVVGNPLNMDGTPSAMSERAAAFAEALERKFDLSVHTHDERLTTHAARSEFEAAKAVGRAATEHELAACLIAESWLQTKKGSASS